MRVRLGEALRYLRQPLRERARERDDMKRPFFQLLQVRKMRLEPAFARAHFLNPREKRGASCGVCPVHCPGRTSRALPPRDDSLLGGGRRRAVPSVLQRRLVLVRRGRHLGGSRRCDACRGAWRKLRSALERRRGEAHVAARLRLERPIARNEYLEYTFFNKIVYSRYTKYHHGLPRQLNEECGEKRSFDGVVARPNSMVISRSLVLLAKTNRCNND